MYRQLNHSGFNLAPEPWRDLLSSYFSEIADSPFFSGMAAGSLSIDVLRYGLINIYPVIENFPTYLSSCLSQLPVNGDRRVDEVRGWLKRNIRAERYHARWFREFGIGFGVPKEIFEGSLIPDADINRLNFYLREVSTTRPISECLAAISVSVEGATGVWTKRAQAGIRECARRAQLKIDKRMFLWIDAHARYDDLHPVEAFRLMQSFVNSELDDERVILAATQALELYLAAARKCASTPSGLLK